MGQGMEARGAGTECREPGPDIPCEKIFFLRGNRQSVPALSGALCRFPRRMGIMQEAIIGGVFALSGVLLTFLGNYLLSRNARQRERMEAHMKKNLAEIKAFYNLEQLYMTAVADLRAKLAEAGVELPDGAKSTAPLGVQREFHSRNEENGNGVITMTAHSVDVLLDNME